MKTLLILSKHETEPAASNIAAMASFLGANVRTCDASNWRSLLTDASNFAGAREPSIALAVDADTLQMLYRQDPSPDVLRRTLLTACALFLYGVSAKEHDTLLQWLSGGSLTATRAVDGADHGDLPLAGKPFTHQLAGTQYPRPGHQPTSGLVAAAGAPGVLALMTVSQVPTLVCARQDTASLFVSTACDFPDPAQPVVHEAAIEAHYDALLPLLIFVRAACRPFSWHGGWKAARLIIDDPVLRRRYGCLDFRSLFDSLQRHSYAATVAYIPWNQSRTSRAVVPFFVGARQRFALCVHGCDHTNNEYGSLDGDDLLDRSRLAMDRMREHGQRTGIECEPVMVFPQGRFSTSSLRALQSSKFLGAINSTRFPVDREAQPVALRDLLTPAILRPYGFPVFIRHYPKSHFSFTLDLFLGRPAFIVEHHEFFRDGIPAMEALADRLNDCEPDLSWGPLGETIERTCWKRAVSDTLWQVRFFSDRFSITNDSHDRATYQLLKEEPDRGPVSVALNGHPVSTVRLEGDVLIEVSVDPGETAHVQVRRTDDARHPVVHRGQVYAGKVLARRALSELRDEFLVKHPALLASAKRMARLLRASSESFPRSGVQKH